MKIDAPKIRDIFSYLSAQDQIASADGAFVFGRSDIMLSQLAADAYHQGQAKYLLFTGGTGKDSGFLNELKIPEADFLAACTNIIYRVPTEDLYREVAATNGAENASFGLQLILDRGLPLDSLIVVAHATSLRRLTATLEQDLENRHLKVGLIRRATNYSFDPSNPSDQLEACSELIRLVDYSKRGWCKPQPDLPEDLATFAQGIVAKIK